MLRTLTALVLAPILAVALTLVPSARAGGLPRAYPFAVFEGPAGSLGTGRIAIRKRFRRDAAIGHFLLDLSLVELRTTGEEIFIAEQQVALTDAALVLEGQPTARYALIDVPWTTPSIAAGSDVRACLQLYKMRADGTLAARGGLECRELMPAPPF